MKDFRTCERQHFNIRVPAALVKQLTDLTNFRAAIVVKVQIDCMLGGQVMKEDGENKLHASRAINLFCLTCSVGDADVHPCHTSRKC